MFVSDFLTYTVTFTMHTNEVTVREHKDEWMADLIRWFITGWMGPPVTKRSYELLSTTYIRQCMRLLWLFGCCINKTIQEKLLKTIIRQLVSLNNTRHIATVGIADFLTPSPVQSILLYPQNMVAFCASSWYLHALWSSHLGVKAQENLKFLYVHRQSAYTQRETRWHLGIVGKQLM